MNEKEAIEEAREAIRARVMTEDNLLARLDALLERVTMLERTIEQARDAMNDDWLSREARTGVHPRHEIRRLLARVLDG